MITQERRDEGVTTMVSGLSVSHVGVNVVGDYLEVDNYSDCSNDDDEG